MSKLDELIKELCPDGVEYKKIKDCYDRLRGTPITAGKMKEIDCKEGEIRVFAGGKTVISAKEENIPNANIIRVPAVLVQSRGVIDVVYFEHPFTFKNEMWAYTNEKKITVKYLYYVLKNSNQRLIDAASGMGSLPQISLAVTEDFVIPLPPLPVQEEIVRILDNFTELTAELTAELTDRRKQYEFYRENLFAFSNDEFVNKPLEQLIISLNTGLNPRQFFKLNTNDAKNFYVTIRELKNNKIVFNEKTDKMNDQALKLCNNRSNLEVDDILFSGAGTIGEVAIIDVHPNNWNIKEGVYTIKPNKTLIVPKYLLYILRTEKIRKLFLSKVADGIVKSVPMGEMKRLEIPIPYPNDTDKSLTEQQRIVSILDRFDTLCNDISKGLPSEIDERQKQYEYYRNKLLAFPKAELEV